jgi:hypothetical protein
MCLVLCPAGPGIGGCVSAAPIGTGLVGTGLVGTGLVGTGLVGTGLVSTAWVGTGRDFRFPGKVPIQRGDSSRQTVTLVRTAAVHGPVHRLAALCPLVAFWPLAILGQLATLRRLGAI